MAALGTRKHNSCFRFEACKRTCPVEENFCSANFTGKIKQCKESTGKIKHDIREICFVNILTGAKYKLFLLVCA